MLINFSFLESKIDEIEFFLFQESIRNHIGGCFTYRIFFKDMMLHINLGLLEERTGHLVEFAIMDLDKNPHNEIKVNHIFLPTDDARFKSFDEITQFYHPPYGNRGYIGDFESDDVDKSIEVLSKIVKTIHRINNLKVFT